MADKGLPTRFAPAERAPQEEIERQSERFLKQSLLPQLINVLPEMILVVNKQRQIVYSNKRLLDFLGIEAEAILYGSRPGEVLRCEHAMESEGGCGTTEACRTCGAVLAILAGQDGRMAVEECRIMRVVDGHPEALDLRVWAVPLDDHGERYTILIIADTSDEKRRRALERIFFHDILNTASGLCGFVEVLKEEREVCGEIKENLEMIEQACGMLLEEITAQKELLAAESGELRVSSEPINARHFLHEVLVQYEHHEVARGRSIRIAECSQDITLVSDAALLRRVVGNMVKNALEASRPGDQVTLECARGDGTVQFRVHNHGYIPRDVQLQIFQRSFSTKGKGRGLGTYSMKLLTERYLKGRVFFESTQEMGTTFTIVCPEVLETAINSRQ